MGYYVSTEEQSIFVSKEHFADAYKAMCALNDHDDLKSGGSWGGDGLTRNDPRPAGMTYHPARWFSWMDANYPETCKTFQDIFRSMGFDMSFDDDGNLNALYYNDKIGAEEHFIGAIAPYVKAGSHILWRGEDGEMWLYYFDGKQMVVEGINKDALIRNFIEEIMSSHKAVNEISGMMGENNA